MLYYYIGNTFIQLLDLATFFLNDITTLPFGIDNAMNMFVGTIKALLDIMPWFQTPWILMLLALSISFGLWIWYWVRYVINVIRGAGA